MQNKNVWEKIKKFMGTHFNKKRYFAAAGIILVQGMVALLAIIGVTGFVKSRQENEVIVLPSPEPAEAIFSASIGSIAEKNNLPGQNEEEHSADLVSAVPNEGQSVQAEITEPAAAVFAVGEAVFYPELPEGEILNDYTGDKLKKSKTMGDWRIHKGIDISLNTGSEVYAAADGTVEKVYTDELMGVTVKVSHTEGFVTIYSNLEKNVPVKEGDNVEKGDVIGIAGQTALSEKKEAPHLHIEMLKDGEQINPLDYIKREE